MKIKVKHNELNEVEKKMEDDESNLEKEIEAMLGNLELLREIWQGQDSDMFYNSAKVFFTKMKLLPNAMKSLGDIISLSDNKYKEKDEEYAKEFDKKREELMSPQTTTLVQNNNGVTLDEQ